MYEDAFYTVERRSLPPSLRRRKLIFGLPIGPKQDYKRPWVLLRDGMQIGFYETTTDAVMAMPPIAGESLEEAADRFVAAFEDADSEGATERAFQEEMRYTVSGAFADLRGYFGLLAEVVVDRLASWRTVFGIIIIYVVVVLLSEAF